MIKAGTVTWFSSILCMEYMYSTYNGKAIFLSVALNEQITTSNQSSTVTIAQHTSIILSVSSAENESPLELKVKLVTIKSIYPSEAPSRQSVGSDSRNQPLLPLSLLRRSHRHPPSDRHITRPYPVRLISVSVLILWARTH